MRATFAVLTVLLAFGTDAKAQTVTLTNANYKSPTMVSPQGAFTGTEYHTIQVQYLAPDGKTWMTVASPLASPNSKSTYSFPNFPAMIPPGKQMIRMVFDTGTKKVYSDPVSVGP